MATSDTYTGTVRVRLEFKNTFGSDASGNLKALRDVLFAFNNTGGSDPTVSGFLYGTLTAAAGDIELAHATDPLQSMGDAEYSPGFTVASTKIKLIFVENTDTTNSVTLTRTAETGCPVLDASGDAVTIQPGSFWCRMFKTGTAALTNDSNDHITVSVSAGAPVCKVFVVYGP